jgi:hypothetical protein
MLSAPALTHAEHQHTCGVVKRSASSLQRVRRRASRLAASSALTKSLTTVLPFHKASGLRVTPQSPTKLPVPIACKCDGQSATFASRFSRSASWMTASGPG